jgi:hypothetical protein
MDPLQSYASWYANASYSHRVRPERMGIAEFYVYIQFYCVHKSRGNYYMLMYSSYRHTKAHDGLVQDLGHHHNGFQDVNTVIRHMCARMDGHKSNILCG